MTQYFKRFLVFAALAALLATHSKSPSQDFRDDESRTEGSKKEQARPLPFKELRVPAPGHVGDLVFSHDGTKMAVGVGAIVVVWNVADGKEVVRMQLPEKQLLHRLVFSSDDKSLVWNGREDPLVRIFDVKTGRQLRDFPQPDPYKGRREAARAAAERSGKVFKKEDHAYSSSFCCYSPDGTRMVYGGDLAGLEILEIDTGKVVLKIADHDPWTGCTYSPDGKQIAVHDNEKGIRLWNAHTGKLLQTLKPDPRGKRGHHYVSFSRDGNFLASWSQQHFDLDIWNLQTAKRICTIPATMYFVSVAFSRDNKSILGVTAWNEIMLHNIVAEKRIHRFSTPEQGTRLAVFTPDEKQVIILGRATGVKDGWQDSLFVYDLPAHLLDPAAARIDDVPPEKLWQELTTDNDARLQIVLKALRSAPKETVALFRKQSMGVTRNRQKEVETRIAELDNDDYAKRDEAMKQLQGDVAHTFAPLLRDRHKAAVSGELRNRLTFILGQMNEESTPLPLVRELRVVGLLEDMATKEARELLLELAQGATQARLTLEARAALERLSKSERRQGGRDPLIIRQRPAVQKEEKQFAPPPAEPSKDQGAGKAKNKAVPTVTELAPQPGRGLEIVFSHAGAYMAVGAGANVTVWKVADGKVVVRMQLPMTREFHSLAFSADDKKLVWTAQEDPMLRIFEVKTGRQVREAAQTAGVVVCFSPDGSRIACMGKSNRVDLVEIATGKLVATVGEAKQWGHSLFTPDGKQLVRCSRDDGIRFYDADTGKLLKLLKPDPQFQGGGTGYFYLSPDGNFLAAPAPPHAIQIWDVRAGKRVRAVTTRAPCYLASFSRDNKWILYLDQDEALLHKIDADKTTHHFNPPDRASFAAFTPDEKKVVVVRATHDDRRGWQYSLFVHDLPNGFLDPAALDR